VPSLTREAFDSLAASGTRLEWLSNWLTHAVWSRERFGDRAAAQYLEEGERLVNGLEEVIAAASPRVYDELAAVPHNRLISTFLDGEQRPAIVVFDGLSLREMPALQGLAEASGLSIIESGVGRSALPSETIDFIEQQLGFAAAPSQLPGRRELKDRGCSAYYYSHPGERHALDTEARALLLWSSFPDNTYRDSGARFSDHFAQIQTLMESAWNSTVMTIPRGRRILVTSDHGYVFLGSGLSFSRHRDDLKPLNSYLGGDRSARISQRGEPPVHEDLAVYRERDLVMLKGRIQLHLQGPNANKLYKHGGLSLMEMLTPWLILSG